eukprot:sb/3476237/
MSTQKPPNGYTRVRKITHQKPILVHQKSLMFRLCDSTVDPPLEHCQVQLKPHRHDHGPRQGESTGYVNRLAFKGRSPKGKVYIVPDLRVLENPDIRSHVFKGEEVGLEVVGSTVKSNTI